MSKKSIVISGVTGFVGTNLTKYLTSSHSIVGISRIANFEENIISYSEFSNLHIDDSVAFIHLAGKAHDLKKTLNDEEYYEINTELTKKVFNHFLKSNCKVFVYISSVKAAADVVDKVLTEEVLPEPVTVYGKSKLAAEKYILKQQLPENKRVYILRPCMIHGPKNKGNLNLLYNFVSKGIPYPFGKYENKRSYVSVENLCFIIKELIENKSIKSGIYNIADNDDLSTNELVKIISKTINKPIKILNVPVTIIKVIAKIGDLTLLPLNSERVQKLTESYCVSNKKIMNAIGKELPLTVKEGLVKTIESFNS